VYEPCFNKLLEKVETRAQIVENIEFFDRVFDIDLQHHCDSRLDISPTHRYNFNFRIEDSSTHQRFASLVQLSKLLTQLTLRQVGRPLSLEYPERKAAI